MTRWARRASFISPSSTPGFYFPEQHSWLQREEDMRAGADADLYTVPNDVRNDAESRLKSFPTRQAKVRCRACAFALSKPHSLRLLRSPSLAATACSAA
jgi:hypothetical protein